MFNLLKEAIAIETQNYSIADLKKARENLSNRYRDDAQRQQIAKKQERWMDSSEKKISYILTRMPATSGVLDLILEKLALKITSLQIDSLLDLGAGPGTASWMGCSRFPEIQKVTLIEQDGDLIQLGQRLANHSTHAALQQAVWKEQDLNQFEPDSHDLVVLSYVLGELNDFKDILAKSWHSTQKYLIIVEPGSQRGFSHILQAREDILKLGGSLVLPCPHSNACPMPQGDWCHFTKRIERSKMHRECKDATLGYEDEKFSYCVFAKNPSTASASRILEYPLKRSGHMHFRLCTPQGIEKRIVSRKDKELYTRAKKLEWGDDL
ncbi:MAG: hypothetical protein CK425_08370 [Parachlamydia sp.]|nr:MAG: hypothetical protein CK425_08370 [Parachlamydia sp.]